MNNLKLFSDVKALELEISGLLTRLADLSENADPRSVAIAKTHFETACMWMTRSLFQKGEER